MQFGVEYELAKAIQRDRLSRAERAERAQQLQMIKTGSVRIPRVLAWLLRLWWAGTLKAAVIKSG